MMGDKPEKWSPTYHTPGKPVEDPFIVQLLEELQERVEELNP